MARITALRPGQSPPPVSTPTRIAPSSPMAAGSQVDCHVAHRGAAISRIGPSVTCHSPTGELRGRGAPMSRTARRRRITEVVTPRLKDGEEVLGTASPWAAQLGRTPLLLAGRHLHLFALTDRRL